MKTRIGIRLEDKNDWERRTPLTPTHVKHLIEKHDIEVWVQRSPIRAFTEQEYARMGATIVEDLRDCPVVLAIKEIPTEILEPGKTYAFFSHTIKGQKYNMPMLQRLLDLGCHLLDYERITDENGRRLVFFGNYAGLAGMIDTLWAVGKRLAWEGIPTPFERLRQTHEYPSLAAAKQSIREVGKRIEQDGLPTFITPFLCGFAGYGNVSRGAQEIFDLLPVCELAPSEVATYANDPDCSPHQVYKTVFKEQDMVEPIAPGTAFALQDYYDHPEKYRARFHDYIPYLTLLINGIYWSARYPRLLTRRFLQQLFSESDAPRLRVIGDISCDVEGAIECNLRATDPGNPIYVYDPHTGATNDGYKGRGVIVLAVDNLPCELPREASAHFSETLLPFIPELVRADYQAPFDYVNLSNTIKRAFIAWQGKLTPDYRYIKAFM